jgi:hypothetical protein
LFICVYIVSPSYNTPWTMYMFANIVSPYLMRVFNIKFQRRKSFNIINSYFSQAFAGLQTYNKAFD